MSSRTDRNRMARLKGRTPLGLILGLLLVGGTSFLAGCGDDAGERAAELPVGTEPGQRAPALTGTEADSRAYELRPGGSGTLVVFFRGYRCGLCRERLRELQANLDEYGRLGARVVAATADSEEEVARARSELGLDFPVVRVDSATLGEWGLVADNALPLPGSYLMDGNGVLIFRHVGRNAADRAHDLEILASLQAARGR
jgi:peroxiredoxin